MNDVVATISVEGLAISFIPAFIAIAIMWRWGAGAGSALYATARMLVQLLLIGYVLIYIFDSNEPWLIGLVLLVMLVAASAIAIRTVADRSIGHFVKAFVAVTVSGVSTLFLVTEGVLRIEPWFEPRYVVPLAGMIFSASMTAISLAAERLQLENEHGADFVDARRHALQTALIPVVNSLFAVGLVALPGMMTGQVLSGVSPLVAAKYQIVVMTMLLGATGMAAAIYIVLEQRRGN